MSDGADDAVAAGREAWLRIRESGRSFDDWIIVARALAIGRAVALKEANTDRPYGTYFTRAMARWLRQAGLAGIADTERSRALRVLANLPAILVWRNSLDEAQRRRHNHPDGVYTCWRRSLTSAETKRQDVVPPKPAATRQDVAPSVTAPAPAARSPNSKARSIHFSQAHVQRGFDALRLAQTTDLMKLTRICLEAAIATEFQLLELLPDNQPKTQVRAVMPKTKAKKRQAAPAADLVLQ